MKIEIQRFGYSGPLGYLSRTVPELEAVSIPFIFPDREAAFRVMDGKVGGLLNERLGEKGFQALGYMEVGARNVRFM